MLATLALELIYATSYICLLRKYYICFFTLLFSSALMANARWTVRNFRSNLSLQAGYLVWRVSSLVIGLAHAAPTMSSSMVTTKSQTSATSAPTSTPNASGVSDFQDLASGTQDLAALVGIFATDSVERYAVDYSRGFLSTCAATLSLLGLLGWTRAMVKLALGEEGCENAGFDTKPMRPIFGIAESDRLPLNEQIEIAYLERTCDHGTVKWRILKYVKHTNDSMPFTTKITPSDELRSKHEIAFQKLSAKSEWLRRPWGLALIILTTVLCNGATCLAILPFIGPLRRWSWATYGATFGLWTSTVVGSLLWLYVYMLEHIPLGPPSSDVTKNKHIALMQMVSRGYFVILNIQPVIGITRYVIRTLSFVAALSTILG